MHIWASTCFACLMLFDAGVAASHTHDQTNYVINCIRHWCYQCSCLLWRHHTTLHMYMSVMQCFLPVFFEEDVHPHWAGPVRDTKLSMMTGWLAMQIGLRASSEPECAVLQEQHKYWLQLEHHSMHLWRHLVYQLSCHSRPWLQCYWPDGLCRGLYWMPCLWSLGKLAQLRGLWCIPESSAMCLRSISASNDLFNGWSNDWTADLNTIALFTYRVGPGIDKRWLYRI